MVESVDDPGIGAAADDEGDEELGKEGEDTKGEACRPWPGLYTGFFTTNEGPLKWEILEFLRQIKINNKKSVMPTQKLKIINS